MASGDRWSDRIRFLMSYLLSLEQIESCVEDIDDQPEITIH